MKCANDNNYSVIRIIQDDVYNDKYDWLKELYKNIKNIIKEKIKSIIFICVKIMDIKYLINW
jgi:hypothetical protein